MDADLASSDERSERMDGWLARELPVEWYSAGPYFPTLAAASDLLFRVLTFTILT